MNLSARYLQAANIFNNFYKPSSRTHFRNTNHLNESSVKSNFNKMGKGNL